MMQPPQPYQQDMFGQPTQQTMIQQLEHKLKTVNDNSNKTNTEKAKSSITIFEQYIKSVMEQSQQFGQQPQPMMMKMMKTTTNTK